MNIIRNQKRIIQPPATYNISLSELEFRFLQRLMRSLTYCDVEEGDDRMLMSIQNIFREPVFTVVSLRMKITQIPGKRPPTPPPTYRVELDEQEFLMLRRLGHRTGGLSDLQLTPSEAEIVFSLLKQFTQKPMTLVPDEA